jgi:hypothetical protein
MGNIKKIVAVFAMLFFFSGCFTISYETGRFGGGEEVRKDADFYFWGLKGEYDFSLSELCPNGVSQFRNQATFVDGLLTLITLGIYSPRTVVFECAPGTSSSLDQQIEGGSDARA